MMEIQHFIEKVQELITNSQVGPNLKRGVPEYVIGMTWIDFELEFEMGVGTSWSKESASIRFGFRTASEMVERSDVEGQPGLIKVNAPMKKRITDDLFMKVRWNGIGDRSISRCMACLALYTGVVELASKIELMCDSVSLIDSYYKRKELEQETELDMWAWCGENQGILKGSTKDEILEKIREYDLPVTGTKDELRARLLDYAEEHGDPELCKARWEHRENSVFKTIESYEQHMESLGRDEYRQQS